jgi:hypothetical protein
MVVPLSRHPRPLPFRHLTVLPVLEPIHDSGSNGLERKPMSERHFDGDCVLGSGAIGSQDDPVPAILPLNVPARNWEHGG